jgi:hypothetical protein
MQRQQRRQRLQQWQHGIITSRSGIRGHVGFEPDYLVDIDKRQLWCTDTAAPNDRSPVSQSRRSVAMAAAIAYAVVAPLQPLASIG